MIILGGWANGKLATIVENHNPKDAWVAVTINGEDGLYSPHIYEFAESDLIPLDELQQLRAENEALKAALQAIRREADEMLGYFKDQTFVVQSEVFDSVETVETIASRALNGLDITLWKE